MREFTSQKHNLWFVSQTSPQLKLDPVQVEQPQTCAHRGPSLFLAGSSHPTAFLTLLSALISHRALEASELWPRFMLTPTFLNPTFFSHSCREVSVGMSISGARCYNDCFIPLQLGLGAFG